VVTSLATFVVVFALVVVAGLLIWRNNDSQNLAGQFGGVFNMLQAFRSWPAGLPPGASLWRCTPGTGIMDL